MVSVSTTPSLLEQTIKSFLDHSPLRLNFEDLSGITKDVPDLRLPEENLVHTCSFCQHAQSSTLSHQDCIQNKVATNRQAVRRLAGFHGQCHLGLTDIVEPLIFRDRCLGVFYFGSVIVRGTEVNAKRRILNYCERKGFDPLPYLFELARAKKVPAKFVAHSQQQLRTLVELVVKILDAYGLPLDRYRTELGAQFTSLHRIPILVQAAMRYVHRHFNESLRLGDVAKHVKCNPDYLSRMFNLHLKTGFSEYLLRVRIDHARNALSTSRYNAGEVGFQVGFCDQSYFGKVFKKWTGMTPHAYQLDAQKQIGSTYRPSVS
jgi:AraC-like DNA-binding protein/ligand-binding sensor protein